MKSKISQTNSWQAPDWKDSAAYEGVDSWSNRRWAWEFLRRNTEYQKLAMTEDGRGIDRSLAGRFGRSKVRPYWLDYDETEEQDDVWIVDQVIAAHNWGGWDSKPQTRLTSTEMAIKFDLSILMASGDIALNILMGKIKQLVSDEMENRWGQDKFPKKSLRRPSKRDLKLYLRLIDAGKASALELTPYLYPEYCSPPGFAEPHLVTNGAHNISRQKAKAKKMVEREYLCLVPIDLTEKF